MNYYKILIVVLILLIFQLQYRLWFGEGNRYLVEQQQVQLDKLTQEAKERKERNDALYAEVIDLKTGKESIEERARYELGMIKENETFFQVVE